MEQPKRCTLTWCEAPHDDDTETLAHHYNHIHAFVGTDIRVDVVARWAEPRTRPGSVLPHVSIFTETPSETETRVIDVMPNDARLWAVNLSCFDGSQWLADALNAGADMLAEHEDHENDGLPHRVAETAPGRSGAMSALRAARDAARSVLEEFERFPIATMEALELARWVGEFRGYVRYLTDALDTLEAEGILA